MNSSRSNGSIDKSSGSIARFFKPISKQDTVNDPIKILTVCETTNNLNQPRRRARTTNKRKVRRTQSGVDSDSEADDDDDDDSDKDLYHPESLTSRKKLKSDCLQTASQRQTRSTNAKKLCATPVDPGVAESCKDVEAVATCQPCLDTNANVEVETLYRQSIELNIPNDIAGVKEAEKINGDPLFKNKNVKDNDDLCKSKRSIIDDSVNENGVCSRISDIRSTVESIIVSDDDEEVIHVRKNRSTKLKSATVISSEDDDFAEEGNQAFRFQRRVKLSKKRIAKSEKSHPIENVFKNGETVQKKPNVGNGIAKYFTVSSNSVDRSHHEMIGKSTAVRKRPTVNDLHAPSADGKASVVSGLRKKLSRTEIAIRNLEAKKLKNECKSMESDVVKSGKQKKPIDRQSKKENVRRIQSRETSLVPTAGLRRSPRVKAKADSFISCVEQTSTEVSLSKERKSRPSYRVTMPVNGQLTMKISRDEPAKVVRAKKLLNKAKCINRKVDQSRGKLAPIFAGPHKDKKRMKKMSAAMLRRRRQFLMSGIPEKLQQQAAKAKALAELIGDGWFSTIGHITQSSSSLAKHDCQGITDLKPACKVDWECCRTADLKWNLGEMTDIKMADFKEPFVRRQGEKVCKHSSEEQVRAHLDRLKTSNVSLPVEAHYKHYLEKKSKVASFNASTSMAVVDDDDEVQCVGVRETDGSHIVKPTTKEPVADYFGHTLWTTDYQPDNYRDVIGNEGAVQMLRTWLRDWKKENLKEVAKDSRQSSRKRRPSDSDFESESSNSDYDDDDDDDDDVCGNTALLTGPPGSGKTCAVYAIAKELDFKVFEVNASSRRSGKFLLEKLREATQSHQVVEAQNNDVHESKKIHSFFTSARTNKVNSQDKKMAKNKVPPTGKDPSSVLSLLLLEDVDVVFTEDDGFWSAVNTFMETARRPVVLTTNDRMFASRGRIRCGFKEVKFVPPDIRTPALHLQLMCLADSHCVSDELINDLLQRHNGDLRRSLLSLQFLCKSNVCATTDDGSFSQDLSIGMKLDAAHDRFVQALGTSRFQLPFRVPDDLKPRLSDKILIEKRTLADGHEVSGALSHVFDSWCVMDKYRNEQMDVNRDAYVMPGFEDKLSTVEVCDDALIGDIREYLGELVLQHSASILEPLKPSEDANSKGCLELKSNVKKFQQTSMTAIDSMAACVLPFRHCNFTDFVVDYLPSLRHMYRSEQRKCFGDGRRARRYKCYLSSLWALDSDVISQLVLMFDI